MNPNTFHKFYNQKGLNKKERKKIYNFLYDFISQGREAFKPNNCTIVPSYEDIANKIRQNKGITNIMGPINSKRFFRLHYLLASEMSCERLFIIDPTGVPIDKNHIHSNITPYFGLISSSTGFHKEVYSNLQEMDNWGTREFPPNFRP